MVHSPLFLDKEAKRAYKNLGTKRPVKTNTGGEFAEQILADLIAQGLSGEELLNHFCYGTIIMYIESVGLKNIRSIKMIHFGFSYVGLIFLLMLFIPNIIWTKHKPKDYEKLLHSFGNDYFGNRSYRYSFISQKGSS